MGRYLVKTRARVFQAQSTVQLARLIQVGLVPPDAQVRDLPDGPWSRADQHHDVGRLFRQHDTDRTVVASFAPRPSPEGQVAPPTEGTAILWVKTDTNTVEVRGHQVLERLAELGIVRSHHSVSMTADGPFMPLDQHGELGHLFGAGGVDPKSGDVPSALAVALEELAPRAANPEGPAVAGRKATREDSGLRREVSVVIKLSEEELEYFQQEGEVREVSQVIVLSQADLEMIDDELPGRRSEDEEFILLSADDLEEFEITVDPVELHEVPSVDAPWEKFRLAMNHASHQGEQDTGRPEPTWDLFRGMMDGPDEPRVSGPSESSWRRFQARLSVPGGQQSLSPETTWDNFRRIMAGPTLHQEGTWQRFVRSIAKRRAALKEKRKATAADRPIAGEARIRSGIVRVVEETGPKVRIEGMGEDV